MSRAEQFQLQGRKSNARGMYQWVARIFSGIGAEGSEFPFRDGTKDVRGV